MSFLRPRDPSFLSTEERLDSSSLSTVDVDVSHTSFVFNATPHLSVQAQQSRLPISSCRLHLLYSLEKYRVVIVVGETGSGKSTQIPQYLYHTGYAQESKMICVTEPRRVAATSLALRVSEELGSGAVGSLVGYSIRFDECFDRQTTRIKFVTEGILLQEMLADPLLSLYSVIVLDEVHERTTQIDILMGLIKKVLRRRRDLRLIIASATVDAEYLRDFFKASSNVKNELTATILSVEGRAFNVDVFYLKQPCSDYVQSAVETVLQVHQREPQGDILVFLTGMDEVEQCVALLEEHQVNNEKKKKSRSKHGLKLYPLPMYGALRFQEQLKVFKRTPNRDQRKVVVATNIAETSITIDGIVYVVDCCFVKLKWFNPETSMASLMVSPCSKASMEQRAGRAGRTRPGHCYRLCTEEDYSNLALNTAPEMQRSELSSPVLQLKALGIDNVVKFDFPSAPSSKSLTASLELLFALEAIDGQGNLTRPLGEQMAELPLHPCLSRMLLLSASFECSLEISSIIAMLQVENVFAKPSSGVGMQKARVAHRNFEVAEGDHLTLLNIYNDFISQKKEDQRQWCGSNYLRHKALMRVQELHIQLLKTLKRFNLPIVSCAHSENELDALRKCIVSGLFPNAAYLHSSGNYRMIRGDIELSVHPTSVLYTLALPKYVVFTELVYTTKAMMRDLTVIEPEWLEKLAPHFYERRIR